ncbi:reticulocyte-binding protein 2 homolog a-like isoform X2 [Protopterus annectens]|uniref:reticulocyte-binding protein 2 homolog a-like isoform X2 n=1 Tax=Protopterus annectens TaxID=7888 RepID=UPI001CF97C96|nr:reticulocyte-binding protein 2 homolog a-like isoform X2 [Protopterus annectens]
MEPEVQVHDGFSASSTHGSTRKRQVRFTARHDIMLLREVLTQNPFILKEPGRVWAKIAEHLTLALQDENFEVDGRRCRERTALLLDYYKRQNFAALRGRGTESLYAEKEELLHEVLELEAEKSLMITAEMKYKEQHEEGIDDMRKKVIEELSRQPPPSLPDAFLRRTREGRIQSTLGEQWDTDDKVHEVVEHQNPDTEVPAAKRACQCCCQTYAEILIFLERRAESEQRLREEELALRREELEIQKKKIALEREHLEIEKREREKRFELESQERQVILDILKDQVLKK